MKDVFHRTLLQRKSSRVIESNSVLDFEIESLARQELSCNQLTKLPYLLFRRNKIAFFWAQMIHITHMGQ